MKASLGMGGRDWGGRPSGHFLIIIIIIYSVQKSEKVPVLTQICFSKLGPFLSSITSPDESTQCSNKSVAVYTSFVRAPFALQAPAPVMLQGQGRALVPRNCPRLPGASHGMELDEPWRCCSHVWAVPQTAPLSPGHLPCSLSEINDIKRSEKVSIPTTGSPRYPGTLLNTWEVQAGLQHYIGH